jgi:3-hydroxybutyryl-CoA dehydrogenase
MEKKIVTIIGAGLMGPGIAACSTLGGYQTILLDRTSELVLAGFNKTKQNLDQLLENQLIDQNQADSAKALLQTETDLKKAVKDSFLIIEAVSENLSLKQELFQQLDNLTTPDVIITSNTSGLRITDIAKYAKHPERMVTTHFWFPAHLVPLVEVVIGDKSDEAVAGKIHKLLQSWNKAPVIVKKDMPGQLANRILQAVIRESINIVEMGLASPEDVDTAIKMGMGIRFPVWGPLEHIDAVGLDLALSVQRVVLPGINNNPVPSQYLQDLVDQESLGFKTGKGFYDWHVKDMQELANRRDQFIIGALRILKTIDNPNRDK